MEKLKLYVGFWRKIYQKMCQLFPHIYICIIKRRKLIFVCFSDIPRRAEGNLVGYINNVDLPDATLSATITSTERGITIVDATLHNVPSSIGKKASLKIQLFLKRKFDIIWFKYIHTRF